jgi:hypothetical protein
MIIVLTTRGGDRMYLGANGVTKQIGRAINVFSKTVEKRVQALKESEWYLLNGKGCKITSEPSPEGALGRPHKAKRGRPAAKRGPGRPKGSKNKTAKAEDKRGPGRPKGSKNKPKVVEAEAPAAPVAEAAPVEATANA